MIKHIEILLIPFQSQYLQTGLLLCQHGFVASIQSLLSSSSSKTFSGHSTPGEAEEQDRLESLGFREPCTSWYANWDSPETLGLHTSV